MFDLPFIKICNEIKNSASVFIRGEVINSRGTTLFHRTLAAPALSGTGNFSRYPSLVTALNPARLTDISATRLRGHVQPAFPGGFPPCPALCPGTSSGILFLFIAY